MDDILPRLKSYNDLRKHFSRQTFQEVMTYIAWQNRLSMTPIVTVPQALALAILFDGRQVDSLYFTAVKDQLTLHADRSIATTAACLALAEEVRLSLGIPNTKIASD